MIQNSFQRTCKEEQDNTSYPINSVCIGLNHIYYCKTKINVSQWEEKENSMKRTRQQCHVEPIKVLMQQNTKFKNRP